MEHDSILMNTKDHILTITINRPEKRNSMTSEMIFSLVDIFRKVNSDDDVRCIVITGSGDFFSAGADLVQPDEDPTRTETDIKDIEKINKEFSASQLGLSIIECYKPIIAAINGPAVGIGAAMLIPMDFRLATADGKIGFVFTRRGLVPEAGSSWLLPKVVGLTKATDWLLTGRLIEAKEAYESGFLNGIYESEDLLSTAYGIARDIIEHTSAIAATCTRQLIWRMSGATEAREVTTIEAACQYDLIRSPEVFEGVMSFLEKRPPKFPGRVSKDMPSIFPWWNASMK